MTAPNSASKTNVRAGVVGTHNNPRPSNTLSRHPRSKRSTPMAATTAPKRIRPSVKPAQ